MNLSIRLKNIRESRNLSQEYVGNALGIGQSGYSKIENQKRELSVNELIKLSEIFDLSIENILNSKNQFINEKEHSADEVQTSMTKGYEITVSIKITNPEKEKEILDLIRQLR